MKHLLTAALLITAPLTHAETFSIPNKAGGQIVILIDSPCPSNNNGLWALSYNKGGAIEYVGCTRTLDSTRFIIQWNDDSLTVLPFSDFTHTE